MASIFHRHQQRRALPVETAFGTLHVREPSRGEIKRVAKLGNSSSLSYGFILVDESGKQLFPQNDGETDAQYAERIEENFAEFTPSDDRAIMQAVERLTKPVDPGDLAKNS